MNLSPSKIAILLLSALLAACGGGGGDTSTAPSPTASNQNTGGTNSSGTGGQNPPSSPSDGGSTPSTGSGGNTPPSGGNSGSPTSSPPASAFAATVTQAPADGAEISGTVRILVEGSGIQNVELLPATGYAPLIARGTVTGDRTGAYIDFDTTLIPDGQVTLRVAAFNTPPGQGGSEITAMPVRTWSLKNNAAPAFSAQLVSAPPLTGFLGEEPGSTTRSETVKFEVSGSGLGNVELVSAKDESIIYGRFTISPDRTQATLNWNFLSFNNYSYGAYETRVVAWDVPPGQSGRKIEVMAARTYYVHLPLGCQAEGICGGTAP